MTLGRHEDDRGVIQDLLEDVTHITTEAGAVRGNHYHRETWQWTIVMKGRLLMATGNLDLLPLFDEREVGPFECVKHPPGWAHAWRALEDTECLVLTRGPRSGKNYEDDVVRLPEPMLS
jgi:dTDP-4-dehydrorhamnose 3,5-epimerase-like enzyme